MSTNTRKTVAGAYARIDALDTKIDQILALLEADKPAKPARKTSAKPKARKAAKPKAPTKGSQTRETLSRKDFNRTLTAKARLAGGSAYKELLGAWDEVRKCADAGMTPDEVLAVVLG